MTVMGIDSSTSGVAWTIVKDSKPESYGKINTTKIKDIADKLAYGTDHFRDLLVLYKPTIVVIEKSIFVQNRATFRTLSYIVGAVMAQARLDGCDVYDVEPMAWKSLYGYTPITKKMELLARRGDLDRITAAKVCEALRKEQTMHILKHNYHNWTPGDDTDIWDSAGIAVWGWHTYIQPLKLEVSKEIAFGDKYNLFQ